MSNNREGVLSIRPSGNCRFVSTCAYYRGRRGQCDAAHDIATILPSPADKVRWKTCNGERFIMSVEPR